MIEYGMCAYVGGAPLQEPGEELLRGDLSPFHECDAASAKEVEGLQTWDSWGFGVRVQGSGFRVQGSGFRV